MFYQNSKFNCMSKINQTSNQNFLTHFLRDWAQEDRAMFIVLSGSNPTRSKLDLVSLCTLGNRALYSDHLNFFILGHLPS